MGNLRESRNTGGRFIHAGSRVVVMGKEEPAEDLTETNYA